MAGDIAVVLHRRDDRTVQRIKSVLYYAIISCASLQKVQETSHNFDIMAI